MLTEVAAFVPVAALVICTPGPDTALTVRNALTGGRVAGALFCLLTFGWLGGYSLIVALARKVFDRPRVRRSLDAITGCVLIGLGARLAAEQR